MSRLGRGFRSPIYNDRQRFAVPVGGSTPNVSESVIATDTAYVDKLGSSGIPVSDSAVGDDTSVLQGAAGQTHYRIRSDDSQTLNTDAGWAAALDTNATIPAERIFRVRFELEALGTVTPKLQYRRNGGTWFDVASRAVAEPTQTGTDEVEGVLSAQYANGDATTNILVGSSLTFVAGDGVEGPTAPSSAATSTNAHTEYEWAVRIRKLWSNGTTKGCNLHNDTFEFRTVPSSGGTFSGTYVNPTVTLDCTNRIGGCIGESAHRSGPFRDGNGNLYMLVEYGEPSAVSDEFTMMKSTDDGVQWNRVDVAGAPLVADNNSYDLEAIDMQQVGTTLHIATYLGSDRVRYYTFRTSDHSTTPDTWGIKAEVVKDNAIAAVDQEVAIAVRSNGTVVMFYRIGATFDTLGYKIRSTGGTWGSENSLDTTGSIQWSGASCVVGASDLIHIFYEDNTNNLLYYKTLNSSDVLSSRTQFNATGTSPSAKPVNAARYFDDAGTETIVATYRRSANLIERRIIGGTLQAERTISDVTIGQNRAGSNMPTAHISVDAASKTIYAVYVDATSFDLFYDKSVAGAAYGTDVAVQTGDFYEITSEYSNGVVRVAVDDLAGGYSGGVIYIPIVVGAGPTMVNVSDSATGADTSALMAALPVTDAAVGTDTSDKGMTVTDAATAADTSALTAALPVTDSAVGAESIPTFSQAVTDAATGTDVAALQAGNLLTANDSATASDTLTGRALALADSATAADTSTVDTGLVDGFEDTSFQTDAFQTRPSLPGLADITSTLGSLTQAATATTNIGVSGTEAGTSTEAVSGRGIAVPDSATATDVAPTLAKPGTDSATSTEVVVDRVIAVTDAAVGADTSALAVAPTVTDSGTATESIPTLAKATTDVATVDDAAALAVPIAASDVGTAADAAAFLTPVLATVTDSATAVDAAVMTNVPQNLIAVAVSTNEIDLTWDVFAGAVAYDIERDGAIIAFDVLTNAYDDVGLAPNTHYVYRVRAVV
jgi:hypothetical protein